MHKKEAHGVPYEFMCEFCGREFIMIKSLRNHKAKCTSNPDAEELEEHAKNVTLLQVSWYQTNLNSFHTQYHYIVSLQCDLCEYVCKSGPSKLKKHYSNVHEDVEVSLKCQLCDFEARDIRAIERHVKDHGVAPTTCRGRMNPQTKSCICTPTRFNFSTRLNQLQIFSTECRFTAHHGPTMLAHFESVHETKCRLCSHEARNR